jgi:hypothetical protein
MARNRGGGGLCRQVIVMVMGHRQVIMYYSRQDKASASDLKTTFFVEHELLNGHEWLNTLDGHLPPYYQAITPII